MGKVGTFKSYAQICLQALAERGQPAIEASGEIKKREIEWLWNPYIPFGTSALRLHLSGVSVKQTADFTK